MGAVMAKEELTRTEVDSLRELMGLYLQDYGLSQRELAERIGVEQSTISAFISRRLSRPGDWIHRFVDLIQDWPGYKQSREKSAGTEQIIQATDLMRLLGRAYKADRKDLVEEIASLSSDAERAIQAVEMLRARYAKISKELE